MVALFLPCAGGVEGLLADGFEFSIAVLGRPFWIASSTCFHIGSRSLGNLGSL
jgi:hypothetical protein